MKIKEAAGLGILLIVVSSAARAQSAEPPEDIRDIRGPKSILAQVPVLPSMLGAVLLLTAVGYGLWRWRRASMRTRAMRPFEIALQQLEGSRGIMLPAKAREFAGVVSDIVRRYIEKQFGVGATQRTTEEFLHELIESSSAPLAQQRTLLAEFMQQSDFIKFAGDAVTLASLESLLQSAQRFVSETAAAENTNVPIPAT